MKRFVNDVKRFLPYIKYSAKADLKAEVANSYLNWLWWILDPLLFMLVYTFIAIIVFRRPIQYFPLFVFVGLNMWNFFNKTVIGSVRIVRNNNAIVSKVYIPKFMLILQKMMVNGFKVVVSFSLVIVMMFFYKVPVTINILSFIPVLLVHILVTFGISCFMLHFGVFVEDLYNIMNVVLRLMFYMSGIFYTIDSRIPEPFGTLILEVNPVCMLINSARQCLLYSGPPNWRAMGLWTIAAIVLCIIGVRTIYKYENSYVKVM